MATTRARRPKQNGCPECCCVERICCDDPAKATEALVRLQMRELGCTRDEAQEHAEFLFRRFALVPKSIVPFMADIVQMVRDHKADGHKSSSWRGKGLAP